MSNRKGQLTPVERAAIRLSPFDAIYPPAEKIKAIVVENFPALGRLAAMRFLEWAQHNPEGVVALPTGKTPEYFIRWVIHLLATWEQPAQRRILKDSGVDPSFRPDLSGLRFVQIDEFHPVHPSHPNSFGHYIGQYYLQGFGLDPARALLIDGSANGLPDHLRLSDVWPSGRIDLSLRYRRPANNLEKMQRDVLSRVDQWCQDYEDRIRSMGGLGFFMGGIGPDGHIGFNVRGSDHHSTTRLTETNYETQAAAAVDLGGIENARERHIITIGLGTIIFNSDCTAIIIAAGTSKARVVADAVQQEPDVLYPATVLHRLPGARFYLTVGAAELLAERQVHVLTHTDTVTDEDAARAVIDLAVMRNKPLSELDENDFNGDRPASAVLANRPESCKELLAMVRGRIERAVEAGTRHLTNTTFLHTEPHHDDVMLGELPYVVRHTRDASNTIYFTTMTSGFTSVANRFMLDNLSHVRAFLDTAECADLYRTQYFDPSNAIGRQRDVWQYLDGVAANDPLARHQGIARRMLRDLITVFGETDLVAIRRRVDELESHFRAEYTGEKEPPEIQRLKGAVREWEVESLWGYFGWNCANVTHLRLGFYTGDIFTPEPTMERDVPPILELLRRTNPDVVTLALDPEGSGPDTHYKVLQALTEALEQYSEETARADIRVIGYRNVWGRFHAAEAGIIVPVSMNMFGIMDAAFDNAFRSQRNASFPSHEHDGPFNELAQKIQVEQYQTIKTCLGRDWFYEHTSALIRATRGLVYLRDMTIEQLARHSRELRRATENQ
jgi:glucosamine-6-phosphate deaminase